MLEANLSSGQIRFLDTRNVRNQDRSSGPGESREQETILLVHGFPLDHSMWRHQIEPLSRSFRLIVPDLAGFGQSTRLRPIDSLKGLADELVELLDHLHITSVSFCGLSMGGYIGWQFWRHHKQRLKRLIACNTRAAADSETMARTRRVSAEGVRAEGMLKLAEGMLGRLFFTDNLARMQDEVQLIRNSMMRANPESVAQALEAMGKREDATAWLEHIDKPTLFIAGSHDVITPAEEMRENALRLPGAMLVELPDAGHLSPLENPQAFNRAVETFMGRPQ